MTMKKTILVLGFAAIMSAVSANAATTTCADMEKQVEAAMKTAKLSAADKTSAEAQFKKGQDACKAKKEADANKDFDAVMKMMKK
jgi:hypothetical protein